MQGGSLHLNVQREQDVLSIELRNDGVAASLEERAQRSTAIGLNNVKQRLDTLYRDEASVDFSVDAEGSCNVHLMLPFRQVTPMARMKASSA